MADNALCPVSLAEPQLKSLRGWMGLCVRARAAAFGEEACLKAVRTAACGLLLLDGDISPAARDRYVQACARSGLPCFLLPPGLLWEATGRPGKAMAVQPGSLCQQLLKTLGEAGRSI